MSLHNSSLPDCDASFYLDRVEALTAEIRTGMDAIATNSLDALRRSVSSQETLCAALAAAGGAGSSRLRQLGKSATPPRGGDDTEYRIWQAGNLLRQVNREYDALLAQSRKTVALLSALCDSHTGRNSEPQGTRFKQQTFSCQM